MQLRDVFLSIHGLFSSASEGNCFRDQIVMVQCMNVLKLPCVFSNLACYSNIASKLTLKSAGAYTTISKHLFSELFSRVLFLVLLLLLASCVLGFSWFIGICSIVLPFTLYSTGLFRECKPSCTLNEAGFLEEKQYLVMTILQVRQIKCAEDLLLLLIS